MRHCLPDVQKKKNEQLLITINQSKETEVVKW